MRFASLALGFAAGAVLAQEIDLDVVAEMTADITITGPPAAPTATAAVPTYDPEAAAQDAGEDANSPDFVPANNNKKAKRALRFMKKRVIIPDDDSTTTTTTSSFTTSTAAITTTTSSSSSTTSTTRSTTSSSTTAGGCETRPTLPVGYGPATNPDTDTAFLNNPAYSNAANGAGVPAGYTLAFSNKKASTKQNGYLGYTLLKSYDAGMCAQACNKVSNCISFNLYFERDPTVDPGAGCTNPKSTVNIVCAYYGQPVSEATAKNDGQYRANFHVVIAGSNGYNSAAPPAPIPGYTMSPRLRAAINAPLDASDNNADTFIRAVSYAGPYNPSQCASACNNQANYAIAHPNSAGDPGMVCSFFNSYVLNSATQGPTGTYCGLYTRSWGKPYDVNYGRPDANGNPLTVLLSYGWTRTTDTGDRLVRA